jgi:septum site-determining protein MinD
MVKKGDMLSPDDVLELLAVELLGLIPEDESVITSTNRGVPVVMDGKSRAGQAFRNIGQRLLGEKVPFIAIEESAGFFNQLSRMFRKGGG